MFKFIKRLFCLHIFEYEVVEDNFDYHYQLTCRKCDKKCTRFS